MNMAKQDRLFFASFCVLYFLVFQNPSMNAIQADMDIEGYCIFKAIHLYNQFTTYGCLNLTNTETSRWLPEQCFHICTASKLTGCRSKRENMLIQLNITATTKSIIFPISQYESPVRCSNCHNVQSIVINCNIDSVFDIKECSRISSTAPTRPGTTTDSLTYPAETTTTSATAASQESLSTCKPCPLTSIVSSITAEGPSTLKDTSTTSTSTEGRNCQNNETTQTNSSPLEKQNEISVKFIAASGIGGIIIGAVLALLFVFLLQKRKLHLRSQLVEEHSLKNPAYNKNHRFSDQFYNTNASQSEEYSEIQPNLYSRKSVNNNSTKATQNMKSKYTDSDYDHLNDAFDTDTNDKSMYDHAQYISKTHSEQQVNKDNGDYMQTSPMNEDRSYVEVTGEGSEGFVLDNQKQTGNVTNGHYFVLKKETN
ncbi:uncharacterized protein [Magallana gigas]|uniref:uncharacterized protein isoform X2 n=1 Tax=Magallana gigas TaxID=29159 RepID=UPI003340DA8B